LMLFESLNSRLFSLLGEKLEWGSFFEN